MTLLTHIAIINTASFIYLHYRIKGKELLLDSKVVVGILLFAHTTTVALAFTALINRIEPLSISDISFAFPFPFNALIFVSLVQTGVFAAEFTTYLIAELTWIVKQNFRQD